MESKEETKFVHTILNCVADGVFTVDQDWRITSFNKAAEKITGVPASLAIGRKCSEVFHADLCQEGCAIRETLESARAVIDRPAKILDKQSRGIPIRISAAVLRSDSGKVLGAVETFRDLSAIEQLRREVKNQYTFEDIIGKSEVFQKLFSLLPDIAESDSTVLIEGPSGSGKELVARAIHNLSRRRKRPLVVVNCGTLPANLFESELFGYVRGAFTDAKKDKPGRIAMAEGGTIFFDEIAELLPEIQVKLLRVLQEREFEPLGGVKPQQANVRVVAATNKKLSELVSQGHFRDDLYFRLAVVRLSIPPLRERREDVPLLVEHFIRRFNAKRGRSIEGVTPTVMEILMRYKFPGNVRELENIIEYAFVLCRARQIDVRHLPDELQQRASQFMAASRTNSVLPLGRAEADTIRATLRQTLGNLGQTTAALGISRATLWRKMKKYNIQIGDYRK